MAAIVGSCRTGSPAAVPSFQVYKTSPARPKLVPALTLKAKLAMAMNNFALTRQSLQQALAVDSKAQCAQFLFRLEAYLSNDMQAALPRFRKAHQLNPSDPRATLYLGLTSESLGQTAGAPKAETFLPGARLLLVLGRLGTGRGRP